MSRVAFFTTSGTGERGNTAEYNAPMRASTSAWASSIATLSCASDMPAADVIVPSSPSGSRTLRTSAAKQYDTGYTVAGAGVSGTSGGAAGPPSSGVGVGAGGSAWAASTAALSDASATAL